MHFCVSATLFARFRTCLRFCDAIGFRAFLRFGDAIYKMLHMSALRWRYFYDFAHFEIFGRYFTGSRTILTSVTLFAWFRTVLCIRTLFARFRTFLRSCDAIYRISHISRHSDAIDMISHNSAFR